MKSHASMNRIYRLVWNAALNLWVAVAENAKGRGKSGSARNKAALLMLVPLSALMHQASAADAANAAVVSGAGTVATSGQTTTITQATQKLAIDWTSLSTRANEALVFNQPNAQAIALNRITGSSPSELLGSLTANGQVFILNPNGVLFGAGSQVNVGGLVASTLSMSNADFEAGNYKFSGSGAGSVVNQGTLNAGQGGYLALLAPEVRNEGVMTASLGTALLAAGNKITLNLDNGSLLGYSIDQGAINALAENKQLIRADGGQVLLSAKAMNSLTTATVNNTGVIEARTLQNKAGRILLMGDMETGTVNVGGTLDASAPTSGDGGFVETSAAHVKVVTGTRVSTLAANGKTGKWLIDPNDFTIAASGGDMDAATVASNLTTTNFEIATATMGTAGGNGDINVNQALSWSSANTLTLTAENNININQAITATNGGLTLNAVNQITASAAVSVGTFTLSGGRWSQLGALPAFSATDFRISGGTFIRALGGDGLSAGTAYQIADIYGLQGADSSGMRDKKYLLANNIDASGTANWNSGAGFKPIGEGEITAFTGTFDGNNKTINGLTINRATTTYVGLFGYASSSAAISNVGLVGGSVIGDSSIGGLVGTNQGLISNAYATGSVAGSTNVGGLVGTNRFGTIINAYATGRILWVGQYVGGLVGQNISGTITNAYATVSVPTNIGNGGLVGLNRGTSIITNSFWNTDTSGQTTSAGGTGITTAQMLQAATFASWSIATTGGTSNVWRIYEGQTGPLLRSFLTARTLTDTVLTYDGATQTASAAGALITDASGRNAGTYASYSTQQGYDLTGGALVVNKASLTLAAVADSKTYDGTTASTAAVITAGLMGTDNVTALAQSFGSKNALGTGASALSVDGAYVLNDGNSGGNYNVTVTAAAGTINKATLSVNGVTAQDKVYDATQSAILGGSATVAALGSDVVNMSGTATGVFASKNAGNNKGVTVTGYTLSGTDALNYNLVQPTGLSANITQASLAVTGIGAQDKVYDTSTSATLFGTATVTALGSDVVNVGGSGTGVFANKNVGIGKAVTVAGYTLTGTDAANYVIVQPTSATASISQANLAVTGILAQNKVYDATQSANLGGSATVTALGSDAVNVSGTGTGVFADKNAGNNKGVAVTGYTLSGTDALNYNLVQPQGLSANISQASLAVTGIGASNKTYDATLSATLFGTATVTAFGSDVVNVGGSGTGVFANKNASNNKGVTVTGYTLTGTDALNYTVVQPTGLTASISQASLSVTGVTAQNKVYDAGVTATLGGTATLAAALGSDVVSLSGTGSGVFNDKNVGTGKGVTVSGYTLSGTDAANYAVVQPTSVVANISKANLAVTGVTAQSKVYDTATSAALGGTATVAALGSDVLNVTGTGTGVFADKNAGNAKAVTVSGFTLTGADAMNYNLVQPLGLAANITQASLAVTGVTAQNKVYDGSTSATLGGSAAVAALGGDVVSLAGAGSGVFADKNAANGKGVTVSGYTLSGTDAANYAIVQPASVTANITKADLTVTASGTSKVYDGSTAATVGYGDNRVAGDVLGISGSPSFADKNAGAGKAVNVGGISLSGADAGNYNLLNTTAGTTADINRASLAVVAGDATRMADGTAYTGGNGVSYVGLVGGDTAAMLGGALSYGGSSQGASTAGIYGITPGGLLGNGNYTLGFVSGVLTLTPGGAESSALGGTELVGAYRGSLNTLGSSGLLPHVSVGGGKGTGGDGAATALNVAAAEEK